MYGLSFCLGLWLGLGFWVECRVECFSLGFWLSV